MMAQAATPDATHRVAGWCGDCSTIGAAFDRIGESLWMDEAP